METRINHNPRNPISARVSEKVGAYLTLDFEQPNGNSISLFLPPHMGTVVHLIADLFNSHIGKPVMTNEDIARALMREFPKAPSDASAPLPTGSGISADGAMAIAVAISSTAETNDRPTYQVGDVNERGQVLVRVSDELTSWLDRGKAWVAAPQAQDASHYGWITEFIHGDGTHCISRR